MSVKKWLKKNTASLNGKTVAISGATGGIGEELCAHLAFLGASLILLDRNTKKSEALISRLKEGYPSLSAEHIRLDLADFSLVKEVTEKLIKSVPDYIIFNAGIYHVERYKCSTGYDNVFQVNFASPYYMTRRLMPFIKAKGGRVIVVGSIAHNYSKTDMSDFQFLTRSKSSLVYGNSKRFLMFSLYSLFGEGASLAVTHPGITFTNITAHYPKLIFAIIKYPMKVIFMKPKTASLSILRGVFEPTRTNEWIGPSLFNVWGLPKKQRIKTCSDDERREIAKKADEIYTELEKF